MKVQRGAIIIVDLSGYTEFVKMHALSIIHAEGIISALMVSVIMEYTAPAKLNKLQGDAAVIFVPISDPANEAAVIQWVTGKTIDAFRSYKTLKRKMELANICPCGSCSDIGSLRLKAVFHLGDVVVKGLLGGEELAGDSVIIAHRLLKNSIESDEYFLMTEPYYTHVKTMFGSDLEPLNQEVDGYGMVKAGVINEEALNRRIGEELPIPKKWSFFQGLMQVLSIQYYYFKLRKTAKYVHLPT